MDPSKRIISHMNKSHQLSLIDYLVVYGDIKLSDLNQSSVEIAHINEKNMTISYATKSDTKESITFTWSQIKEDEDIQVNELKDLKPKLVSMAKYSAAKQGFSHVQIKNYPKLSKDTMLMTSLFCIFLIGSFNMELLKKLLSNDPFTLIISSYFPSFVWKILYFAEKNFKLIVLTTYIVHLGEVIFVTIPNIIKFRIPFPQSLCWMILHFIEGFFTIIQFNKLSKSQTQTQ